MNREQKFLHFIETHKTIIKQIETDLTNIEKRIKGIYLWIHKLNQTQSELETKLYRLELAIAEEKTGIKIKDINITNKY